MKHKNIGLFALMMVMLAGCGKNEGVTSVPETTSADTTASAVIQTETAVEEATEAASESPTEEDRTFDCAIFRTLVPDGFNKDYASSNVNFIKTMEDGSTVHLGYLSYTAAYVETDVQNMTLEETIDFFQPMMDMHISPYYPIDASSFVLTEESSEEITVMDSTACKISGHIEGNYGEETLVYTAYYAMVPINVYEGARIPLCWFAFGEDTQLNCEEIESAVDYFVSHSEQY